MIPLIWLFYFFIRCALQSGGDTHLKKLLFFCFVFFSIEEETDKMYATLTSLLPRNAGGSGKTKDEVTGEIAADILKRTPKIIDIQSLQKMYPTKYEESMNTVLVQVRFKIFTLIFL